jgi:hypothetical protein
MEETRFNALKKTCEGISYNLSRSLVHGDAFRVTYAHGYSRGVSLLYLNPPYDLDPIHGRLEQRFLVRFLGTLATSGVLVFVVPYSALKASAETLSREFESLRCFRFPDPDWDSYKQVVLIGVKRSAPLLNPDPDAVLAVLKWASDPSAMPVLPEGGEVERTTVPATVDYHGSYGLTEWVMRPVDVATLTAKARPWMQTTRAGALVPTPGIIPDVPVAEMLLRKYPVAMPPRPAHIAAGIASGIFNGARIESKNTRLPPLLVKGVFDREFRTIEEKKNKEGEVRGVVQVQQPKLVTTVLDLHTHHYHVLKTGTEASKAPSVESMTVADLLAHYGESLMAVMERQCPILYDPRTDAESITLASSPRRLFSAQAHASRALVKLLGGTGASAASRRGKTAILLGEIGSGKSTVSLMAARSIGAKRILILCPPHLLTSWKNEISAVVPEATVRVLQNVADVDALTEIPMDQPVVAILSRESAKLGHGWEGVSTGACPKCGAPVPTDVDLVKKRARCEAKAYTLGCSKAAIAHRLAVLLQPHAPTDGNVTALMSGRAGRARKVRYAARIKGGAAPVWAGIPSEIVDRVLAEIVTARLEGEGAREKLDRALLNTLLAANDTERLVRAIRLLMWAEEGWGGGRDLSRDLVLLLPPGSDLQMSLIEEMRAVPTHGYYGYGSYGGSGPWGDINRRIGELASGKGLPNFMGAGELAFRDGHFVVAEHAAGSMRLAREVLASLCSLGHFPMGPECGEPLFQASPAPLRYPLARLISMRHPRLFDFLVLDEGHEYATDGSAQERSAHRLTGLGLPTILMTGTIMNGYAESLFTNFWALSPAFRTEFDRSERTKFVDRYGYRKRLVEDKDKETGKIVEFGSHTDRVERQERFVGNAPGVLPLFLLRHLLPMSVTLHKTDLAIDLPPCRQHRHLIQAETDVMKQYRHLLDAVLAAVRKDQFEPDMAGKLFGQLSELPSYLDRATGDVGNCDKGVFEVRYPESVGSALVAAATPLDPSTLLAKEEWMLRTIEAELAEGRNVMVFAWHITLLPRLARIISERIGETVPVLYADKVSTAKRQDWIDREIVKKKRQVLVTNPVCIQTGLNNLVHFATEVWMQNPACNPVVFRQAIGRIDRIGQKIETRVHVPIYVDTLQEQLHDLLMHKVAVSVSTDGLDPEAALQAAGVAEDEYLAGLSIGKQLYAMLTEGSARERARDEEVFRVGSTHRKPAVVHHEPSVMDLIGMIEAGA